MRVCNFFQSCPFIGARATSDDSQVFPAMAINSAICWTWLPMVLLNLVYLPTSSGIQCYYCTSDSDSRCRDTSLFYSQTLTDQPSDCTQEAVDTTLSRIRNDLPSPDGERGNYDCAKVELLKFNGNYLNRTIIRGCFQGQTRKFDPCRDLQSHFVSAGDLVHCSVCKTDGCNQAPPNLRIGFLTYFIEVAVLAGWNFVC